MDSYSNFETDVGELWNHYGPYTVSFRKKFMALLNKISMHISVLIILVLFLRVAILKLLGTSLKGQCHELVGEMSPWSNNLGLN
jgi:hypothetical protein